MMSFHQDAIVHRVRAIHRPLSGSDSLIECSCCDSLLSDVLSSSAPTLCHSNSSISLQSTSEAGSSSVHSHSSSDDIVVSTEITSTTNLHDSSSCVVSPKGDINESDQLSIGSPNDASTISMQLSLSSTSTTSTASAASSTVNEHSTHCLNNTCMHHDNDDNQQLFDDNIIQCESNEIIDGMEITQFKPKRKMKSKLAKSTKEHQSNCSNSKHHRRYHQKASRQHYVAEDFSSKRTNTSLWLQLWQPSYKARLHQFQRQFSEIPLKEKLIDDFLCALQRDILCQGRLYVSLNFISFYSNILGYETVVTINYRDIKKITKATTIKLFPNAIEIVTLDGTKYFFTSFVSRDRAFKLVNHLWNNTVSDKSIPWTDVCKLIRDSYTTNDLGVNLSDIDGADVEINLTKKKLKKKKLKNRKSNSANPSPLLRSDSVSSFCTCPEIASNTLESNESEFDSQSEDSAQAVSLMNKVHNYLMDRRKFPNLALIVALLLLLFQFMIISWLTTVYTRLDLFKQSLTEIKAIEAERLLITRQAFLSNNNPFQSTSSPPSIYLQRSFVSLLRDMSLENAFMYCNRST